ncbi:uncharacterized protein CBL_00139 [Carabus blaptoides fortunei]
MDALGKIRSTIIDLGTEKYQLYKVIGEGTYSKVYLALRKRKGRYDKHVACKVIKKRYAGHDFINKFLPRELNILRVISHPNIITVFHVAEMNNSIYIFMNYCKQGDMLDHIRTRGSLTEQKSKHFFQQIVSAILYLHNMDIAHRDLKCENVFLNSKNNIKIGDFGFARFCYDETTGEQIYSNTFCGSAAYAAPEIIQGLPYNPKSYDIWSMGCILYIMLTAQMPFDDTNAKRMLKFQQNRTICFAIYYEMHISSELKKLLTHLLEPDVQKRATILQVAVSKWLMNSNTEKYSEWTAMYYN